jgi:hypothetical protein
MKPEHYQKLAEAKLTVEQIGIVMQIMAEAEDAMKAAEDARKSVARERVQRWRDKQKACVTSQKRNGDATVRLTRAEDSSSNSKITEKDNISHEFESEIWPAYPRKSGKGHALKAYRSARKRASFDAILAGVKRYASERAGEDPKFTKQAQGWFSGDHWTDEPQPKFRPNSTAPPGGSPKTFDEGGHGPRGQTKFLQGFKPQTGVA